VPNPRTGTDVELSRSARDSHVNGALLAELGGAFRRRGRRVRPTNDSAARISRGTTPAGRRRRAMTDAKKTETPATSRGKRKGLKNAIRRAARGVLRGVANMGHGQPNQNRR
jgi:hypothetical protein